MTSQPQVLDRFTVSGMYYFLQSGLQIQTESHWLAPQQGYHYCSIEAATVVCRAQGVRSLVYFLPPASCVAPLVTVKASQCRGRFQISVSLLSLNLAIKVCSFFSKKSLMQFWWPTKRKGKTGIILEVSQTFMTHKDIFYPFIDTFNQQRFIEVLLSSHVGNFPSIFYFAFKLLMKVCIWLFLDPSLWLQPAYLYCLQSHFFLTLPTPSISLSIFTEPIFSWHCSLQTPSDRSFLISWLLWVLQTKHTKLRIQSTIHI